MPLTLEQKNEIIYMIEKDDLNIDIIQPTNLHNSSQIPKFFCTLALKLNDEVGLNKITEKIHALNQLQETKDLILFKQMPGIPKSWITNQNSDPTDIALIIDFEYTEEISLVNIYYAKDSPVFRTKAKTPYAKDQQNTNIPQVNNISKY